MSTFTIQPRGPFSLLMASAHEFGPRVGATASPILRLAFCADSLDALAGVVLRQDRAGTVHGEVVGDAGVDVDVVRAQVARVLSLDHDGTGWPEVGERDPVLGALQARFHGFRPVLFHSPYEAAAWAVISGHRSQRQADAVRRRLCAALGATLELEGETLHAFPTPARLLRLDALAGLGGEQVARLHGVAGAALAGRLDTARLRALSVEEARAEVMRIPGIGPFFSGLVVIRGAGPVDACTDERKLHDAIAHFYGPGASLQELADRWRPYRAWATVLLRRAACAEFGRVPTRRAGAA